MDLGVFFASFGISLLELSEAGAVAAIYHNILKNNLPFIYAIAGVLIVLIPTFTLGKYIYLIPINYFLIAAAIILFYFGYRLIRSARRYFKNQFTRKKEEKEEGVGVVFTISAVEGLEASLVILALIPKSYFSALAGAIISGIIVIILTALLKAQIARIRLPHLKFVLSALLFSLGSMWILEVFTDVNDVFLAIFFLIYLGINYIIVKS